MKLLIHAGHNIELKNNKNICRLYYISYILVDKKLSCTVISIRHYTCAYELIHNIMPAITNFLCEKSTFLSVINTVCTHTPWQMVKIIKF